MHIRRSHEESIRREQHRQNLAKRVAGALSGNTIANRTAQRDGIRKAEATFDARPTPQTNHQITQLNSRAIHAAKEHLRTAGMGQVPLFPYSIDVQDEVTGSRFHVIRKAAIILKAKVPVADGKRVSSAEFLVNLSYDGRNFSVDSLQRGSQTYTVHKASLDAIRKAQVESGTSSKFKQTLLDGLDEEDSTYSQPGNMDMYSPETRAKVRETIESHSGSDEDLISLLQSKFPDFYIPEYLDSIRKAQIESGTSSKSSKFKQILLDGLDEEDSTYSRPGNMDMYSPETRAKVRETIESYSGSEEDLIDLLQSKFPDFYIPEYLDSIRKAQVEDPNSIDKPIPAAACPRCGGWTSMGGMSQYSDSEVPVDGRPGCSCHRLKKPNSRSAQFRSASGGDFVTGLEDMVVGTTLDVCGWNENRGERTPSGSSNTITIWTIDEDDNKAPILLWSSRTVDGEDEEALIKITEQAKTKLQSLIDSGKYGTSESSRSAQFRSASNGKYIIKVGGWYYAGFDSEFQIVQATRSLDDAKTFNSEQQARRCIEKYADAGYGMMSKDCEILPMDDQLESKKPRKAQTDEEYENEYPVLRGRWGGPGYYVVDPDHDPGTPGYLISDGGADYREDAEAELQRLLDEEDLPPDTSAEVLWVGSYSTID